MSKMIHSENTDSLSNLLENYEKQKAIDTEQDWDKVHKRIRFDKNKNSFFLFAKMSVAIFLPLFLLWQYVLFPYIDTQNSVTVASSQYGTSKVTLSDGTEVWLNVSSKLTYPQKFNKNNRSVKLEGEAYFKVKADKKKPFNVSVDNKMMVTAYGTEFNVSGYVNLDNYTVILASGSVKVSLPITKKSVYLQPGQQAHVTPAINEIYVNEGDVYLQTAWKDGKMIFYREKLRDIADRLSKRFDVTFEFDDKTIEEQQYTGTFTTESVTEILDLLKQSAPIDYTVRYSDENSTNPKRRIITLITK